MTARNIAIYVAPPSHHFFDDKLFEAGGNAYGGDQILAPYVAVKEYFASRGIPVHTSDKLPSVTDGRRIIFISFGMRGDHRRLAAREDVTLSAFFAMECPIVEPALYRALPDLQRYYKRLFSWSDSDALLSTTRRPLRLEPFFWPQSFDEVHEGLWGCRDRKFLVMMNSNKLPVLNWNELYRERLKAVEFFSKKNEIDLYGRGWERAPARLGYGVLPGTVQHLLRNSEEQWRRIFPDPAMTAARKAWRGVAPSKSETISKYTFAMCFENSVLKGWITEKIFDCFFVGTVPIYWGAPEITDYVPKSTFIDMRDFSSYEELRSFLKGLGPNEISAYRQSGRDFIASSAFHRFSKAAFVDIFRKIVKEDAGVAL